MAANFDFAKPRVSSSFAELEARQEQIEARRKFQTGQRRAGEAEELRENQAYGCV